LTLDEDGVEELDRKYWEAEQTLNPDVPLKVRQRITTTRNLAVYGGFSYGLSAVSLYWTTTCIEMALYLKRCEIDPSLNRRITMKGLLDWAKGKRILTDEEEIKFIRQRRNDHAHPRHFNSVVNPGAAYDAFLFMIKIIWPVRS
jgi:hypothetical protein